MTRKIFRSILLVAGVVLAAGMVIMTGCTATSAVCRSSNYRMN